MLRLIQKCTEPRESNSLENNKAGSNVQGGQTYRTATTTRAPLTQGKKVTERNRVWKQPWPSQLLNDRGPPAIQEARTSFRTKVPLPAPFINFSSC